MTSTNTSKVSYFLVVKLRLAFFQHLDSPTKQVDSFVFVFIQIMFLFLQSHGNLTTIWERICKYKKPVVEPRQSTLFQLAIEVQKQNTHLITILPWLNVFLTLDSLVWFSSLQDYMAKLRDPSTSGAVFFAVCRGKVFS